jgi:hypothetical protein
VAAGSLDGPRLHAVWLLAPDAGYGEPTGPVRVTLAADVAPGRWGVEWRDEDSPDLPLVSTPVEVTADGGPFTVEAPAFRKHVVGFLVRH